MEINEDLLQVFCQEVFEFVESELFVVLGIVEVSEFMDLSNSLLVDGGFVYVMNCYGVMGIFVKLYFNVEVYIGMLMYDKVEIVVFYIIDSGQYVLCGEGCFVFNLGKCLWVDLDFEMLEGYVVVFVFNNEGNFEYIFLV